MKKAKNIRPRISPTAKEKVDGRFVTERAVRAARNRVIREQAKANGVKPRY